MPNARAIVSLTYDDALPQHRAVVAPDLERRGLRATFYTPAAARDLHAERDGWRRVAAAGHELGNHTCFHPCRRRPGATWPDPAYDLRAYGERRFVDELVLANDVLAGIDGRAVRSFASTCGHLTVGDGADERDVTDAALRHVACIRSGVVDEPVPASAAARVVGAFHGDGKPAQALIAAVDAAVARRAWLIVIFHGVGAGAHGLFVDDGEHRRLIDHLAGLGDAVRALPVIDAWQSFAPR